MATQTEQAGLESRPGTQPLSDADKDTIRKGEFDESIIPAFVHNDPRGCCNLLSEGSWIKRLIHYQLINAILGSLTEGDYLYPQAKRVQGDIAAAMTAYEDLSDEQKADAEAAVQATQLWVEQARKKREQEQAAREENALVALGDVDSSAPPEKGPPRESDFETKKLRVGGLSDPGEKTSLLFVFCGDVHANSTYRLTSLMSRSISVPSTKSGRRLSSNVRWASQTVEHWWHRFRSTVYSGRLGRPACTFL